MKKTKLERCPICMKYCKQIYLNFPGYIEGTSFDIFGCETCKTHFIPSTQYQKDIYQKIYKQTKTPGYEEYYRYAMKIENQKKPLKYLSKQEPGYFPVYKVLKNTKKLDILEIGCSYGYLSYALKKEGHNVLGIDCSKNAINFAKRNFGGYYQNISSEKFNSKKKFDLIIAIEIIEHLKHPRVFIKKYNGFLKKGGKIIIATPNKDSRLKNQIWCSDLPPVHMCCLGEKSIKYLAKEVNLDCKFFNFSNYYSSKENKLLRLFESKNKNKLPHPRLKQNDCPIEEKMSNTPRVLKSFLLFPLINYISHLISYLTSYECTTLGAILTDKT